MIVTISPSSVKGTVISPSSKSVLQRVAALALLNNGTTIVQQTLMSDDEKAALDIIQECGAKVSYKDDLMMIESKGSIDPPHTINCSESGLALRMFTPILSISDKEVRITGEGSLMKRDHSQLQNLLAACGVSITSNDGRLPFTVKGPLIPSSLTVDGSESSQHITGLLFAFARAAMVPVTIEVSNLKSKPYIDLSLQLLKQFGYNVSHEGYYRFHIIPSLKTERTVSVRTEGDWSNSSFLLVAAAISGEISITGLEENSAQGDKIILEILRTCGADITESGRKITVTKNALQPFQFDATDFPDLFPPLVVLAASCNGLSTISGCSRLINKESNRAETLTAVFSTLGAEISAKDDLMFINGHGILKGGKVHSHNDHRIAMAAAIAALISTSPVMIEDAEAVKKSFPAFYSVLQQLGVEVSIH